MPNATILAVDDDPLMLRMPKDELEDVGYKVVGAADGKEAIALHHSSAMDLIITDLLMPGMEGIETIIELRRRQPNLKIIAMSSGPSSNLYLAKQLGAAQVLTKPFTIQQLLASVKECLGSD